MIYSSHLCEITDVFSVLMKGFVQPKNTANFYCDFPFVTFTEVRNQLRSQALPNAFCLEKTKRQRERFHTRQA